MIRKAGCWFLAIAVLLGAGSCDRYIESRDPVRSLPGPPPTPTNLSVVVNYQTVTLSWEVSDTIGLDRFRIYRSDVTDGGNFVCVDSTSENSITVAGMLPDREYLFRVAAVQVSGIEGYPSEPVLARTGLLSILIADGHRYTNTRHVRIQLVSCGPTLCVTLSEDSAFADSVQLPFLPSVEFELSDGDGLKTVYARFTLSNGSRSQIPVSDDIILDTRAEIRSVTFSPQAYLFTTGDTIKLMVDAGEDEGEASVSFPGVSRIYLFNDGNGDDVSSTDSVFTGRYVVPGGLTVTDGKVTGSFTDAAGNTALGFTSWERLNIACLPTPVQLTVVEAISTFEISLGWTRYGGSDFSAYRIFRDNTADVTDSSTLVETIANVNTTIYVDTTLDAGTQYYYCIYLRDNLGRDTASNVMAAVTSVNEPPTAVILAGALDGDASTARLTWSLNTDDDFESYRVYRDTTSLVDSLDQRIGYVVNQATTTFSDFIPTGFDSVFYRVYVHDRHGLETGSNVIQVVQ